MIECPSYNRWDRSLVAYHLRNIEDGSFEGCRTACDEGGGRVGEECVGLVVSASNDIFTYIFIIIFLIDAWGTGKDWLIVSICLNCL